MCPGCDRDGVWVMCSAALSAGSKEGQVKSEDHGRDIASVQALLSKQVSHCTYSGLH